MHRDVKPGNIIVADDPGGPHAYLTDFGLSKNPGTDSIALTKMGQLIGTLAYTAPEKIFATESRGYLVDIYSLGCVMYEALTGAPPFARERDIDVLYAHVGDPRPKASQARPDLPAGIDDVIAKAMAISASERYSTCAEFIAAARALLPVGDAAHPRRPRSQLPLRTSLRPRPPSRRHWRAQDRPTNRPQSPTPRPRGHFVSSSSTAWPAGEPSSSRTSSWSAGLRRLMERSRPTTASPAATPASHRTGDGAFAVADEHSRNGTFVNGERLERPRVLRTGDQLKIGSIVFEATAPEAGSGSRPGGRRAPRPTRRRSRRPSRGSCRAGSRGRVSLCAWSSPQRPASWSSQSRTAPLFGSSATATHGRWSHRERRRSHGRRAQRRREPACRQRARGRQQRAHGPRPAGRRCRLGSLALQLERELSDGLGLVAVWTPADADVSAVLREFRLERGLLSAEDLRAWMSERGLTLAAVKAVLARGLARNSGGTPEAVAAAQVAAALPAEAVCSGAVREIGFWLADRMLSAATTREIGSRAARARAPVRAAARLRGGPHRGRRWPGTGSRARPSVVLDRRARRGVSRVGGQCGRRPRGDTPAARKAARSGAGSSSTSSGWPRREPPRRRSGNSPRVAIPPRSRRSRACR